MPCVSLCKIYAEIIDIKFEAFLLCLEQFHGIFWVERDPQGSLSPALKWINSEIHTGIKQGLNFCSWSWLFSFAVPTTFVMNQCLKSCFSWFLFSFFCMTNLIFWYFSLTFLRLSLSCCILFPLFISQVLELFLSIHSLNFPLPSEGSTPLSFCPLTSCPVWEDVCSSTCWQVQPGHRRAVPPEESAVACLNPCLGWVFV